MEGRSAHAPGAANTRGADLAVFIGVATFDAIAMVRSFPGRDERMIAEDIVFAGGGPAATAAITAARLGVPSAFIGTVGDDVEAELIISGLRHEDVDVSGIMLDRSRRSGASVVVVDASAGTRAICTRPTPPLVIPPGSPAAQLLSAAAWVHVDQLGWAAAVSAITTRHGRPKLSVDAGNPIDGFRPSDVDIYAPTIDALRRIYGEKSVDDLLDSAIADGARTVVATRGGEGSIAATADGHHYEAPAHPVDVVSTLGAGDVFHGALLAGIVHGFALDAALRYANAAAAMSCRGIDGRSAIPRHDQIVDLALTG